MASSKNNKAEEQKKSATVYSTAIIKQILEDMKRGFQPDMTPFFQGDLLQKDAGLLFKYTDEEIAELEKCSQDCIYFVEKYCKFLNDKGRTLVKLRDFQKDILNLYSAEKWDGEIEGYVPENPYIILLQSRQTGKCIEGCSHIRLKEEKGIWSKLKKSLRKILMTL